MPEIRPFRALHYDVARVGDLSRVVGQPYDKVDDRLSDEYYARHPNHIVRIDRRRDEPGDWKYASAADELNRWIREGVLVEESQPALWAVRQTYSAGGRRLTRQGICAMVRLEEFGKGRIHPHEETHAGPKADRLKLLRAAHAHVGHIFMLYPDPKRTMAAILDRQTSMRPPDLKAVDDAGESHEAWKIDDLAGTQALVEAMGPLDAIIADGHHRYETALAFRRECEAQEVISAGAESHDYVLATLIDMDDRGLTCFPTHRVIGDRPGLNEVDLMEHLKPDFDFLDHDTYAEMLEAVIEKGAETPAFGVVLPARFLTLSVRDLAATAKRVGSSKSLDWRSLDVNILHTLILEGILGITPDDTAHERYVTYVRSAEEAVKHVRVGSAVGAFILNPVRIDQLMAVVRQGEKFPQKSTDFYPKMLSGFLMCKLRVGNKSP